ncbi:Molybdopterin oxidoreductase Fe4S4 domain-containing protein [Caloramator fervidus]|mgnify:CR=1 FL=1|uniref:Molybdopterin oxidoreductase Fe4S4 domain-containing protein n=1 Tax=Caloramator fervidus TaxID=29344 RepID=A0A1H5XAT3_9CLOT|nr:2Fe-2S iron-sulfur cluster-binding protein [Caloramator fervidus]SEG08849.1 Molybdopterin oxidoreductase Fe4S4 domain-containing protein [Caloramator fervidus]
MITLTINGKKIRVASGTTILGAAQKLGIDIPTLCYDPMLEVYGGCRICVVEVEGAKSLMAACATQVQEGMVVYTESEKVIKARKEILALLLANHPNDCLTCEKAGVCKLQEYAYRYDVKFGQIDGERHNYELEDSNPYIVRDMNKCILCGKCVRTCAQVEGRKVLTFAYRGFKTKVTTAFDKPYEDSDCAFCFRCVAVCPVGALKDKRASGKARHWEVSKEEFTCTFCDYGCKFEVARKHGKAVYVTPKAPSEGRPLCLKGKIGNELKYLDDVETPYIRVEGKLEPVSWAKALGLEEILYKIETEKR